MSGGSLNYLYAKVEDAIPEIEHQQSASSTMLPLQVAALLRMLSPLLHDLEWWIDGDYGESQFLQTCLMSAQALKEASDKIYQISRALLEAKLQ